MEKNRVSAINARLFITGCANMTNRLWKKSRIEFAGKVWKDPNSSWWLIEIDFLEITAKGRTEVGALNKLKTVVMKLLRQSYKELLLTRAFRLTVNLYENGVVGLGASDDKLLFALGLKRQRVLSGSTVREVSKRLKSTSPNAYARYERAQTKPSLEKYADLVHAANPKRRPLLVS
jgi:hypothetical protein